ncbi:MAG: PH domain-containing protein [Kangiellaceae bacterium]|jgi:hypothetical protein|nr:PH domain-containing protein [Kangiellaceae bacterium]
MTKFKSKVDLWLGGVIYLSAIFCLAITSYIILYFPSFTTYLVAVFIVSIGSAFPLWLVHATYYQIDETRLIVKSGPFKWIIKRSQITNIEASHNPISSPALSLDRLKIYYGNGQTLLISPSNKDQFLSALKL